MANVAITRRFKLGTDKITFILKAWNDGLWDAKGLAFAIQMMLMLLLGHVLAISSPVNNFINKFLPLCNSNARSAFIVTFFTLILSWFNWGLGLVFGAIFCKKIIENASQIFYWSKSWVNWSSRIFWFNDLAWRYFWISFS